MPKKHLASYWLWAAVLLCYAYLSYLMALITLQYLPISTDIAFLRIKQDYIGMTHYRVAFFIHVFTSIFVLLAGFTQFSTYLRCQYYRIHQWSGWLYTVVVLLFAAPSGFIIGIYANGGIPSQIAFCLLAVLWFAFTAIAISSLLKKNIIRHQNFMIRSFALALSALTLRAWKYVLVAIFHPKPMDVYMVIAWLGWVLNLLIAEIIIFKKRNN